jgi:2,3-bisphosphoglycerate-dependent phosphoglycerate mutase
VTVRLYLVRHGATAWTEAGRLTGWADVPLSDRGRIQARGLRSRLNGRRFAGVWSSDLARAVETAAIAAGDQRRDGRLRELDFGTLEGMTWTELPADMRRGLVTFEGFRAPGGESVDQFRARVRRFVEELTPGDHLVVTHGGVARLLLREAGGDRVVPPGSAVEVAVARWPTGGEARAPGERPPGRGGVAGTYEDVPAVARASG